MLHNSMRRFGQWDERSSIWSWDNRCVFCSCWLESMVYMIANEGRTGVPLSLNSALLQHRLNSALAWAVLDGDFTKLVWHLWQLSILQHIHKLQQKQIFKSQATTMFSTSIVPLLTCEYLTKSRLLMMPKQHALDKSKFVTTVPAKASMTAPACSFLVVVLWPAAQCVQEDEFHFHLLVVWCSLSFLLCPSPAML